LLLLLWWYIYICIYLSIYLFIFFGDYTMSCYTHFFTVSSEHFPLRELVEPQVARRRAGPRCWSSSVTVQVAVPGGGTFWKKHHEISGRLWRWYKWYKWYLKMINSDNSNMFMLYLCIYIIWINYYIYTHMSWFAKSRHILTLTLFTLHISTLFTSTVFICQLSWLLYSLHILNIHTTKFSLLNFLWWSIMKYPSWGIWNHFGPCPHASGWGVSREWLKDR
jgi:hypothetical protein